MDGMAPADVPTLAGPRLTLRGIRPEDLQTFLGRTRDPEIVRMRGGNASRASFAIGIDEPSLLGQGLGKEATRLVLTHAFGPAALHRVDLRVLAYNTRAISCYRACGFLEEGRERQAALVDGTWHDFVIMSILESDPTPTRRMP
jgi:RimJ/RimL family protein N-acetyltransferase